MAIKTVQTFKIRYHENKKYRGMHSNLTLTITSTSNNRSIWLGVPDKNTKRPIAVAINYLEEHGFHNLAINYGPKFDYITSPTLKPLD